MDLKSGTFLTPPSIKNVSCNHERYSQPIYYYIGPLDFLQALIIFFLTIGIIGANLMLIFVINHRRYSPYIDPQVILMFDNQLKHMQIIEMMIEETISICNVNDSNVFICI